MVAVSQSCEFGTRVITIYINLSWSHKLFLRVNAQIGQRPRFDRFMYLSARWLMYLLALFTVIWGLVFLTGAMRGLFFATLGATLVAAYGTSLTIALAFPHRRPVKELPHIKTLVNTLGTWKSFPSDHTLWSFVMALTVVLFGASVWLSIIMLVAANLVASARVYAGVHYPRDIVGGIVLAMAATFVVYFYGLV